MKNKLLTTLITFLLLVPLRLPISILFIRFFKWLLGETTTETLPLDVVATNVIVTKMVYNLALSSAFLYSIEMLSRERLKRRAISSGYSNSTEPFFWWVVPIGVMLVAFVIMDAINVNAIFFSQKR